MFDEDMKREILNDANNKERQKFFAEADSKAEAFIGNTWPRMNLDQILKFLSDAQLVRGHFSISKEISKVKFGFKL